MQFKLTKEFLDNIRVLISGGNGDLQECLEELHVADIADIMEAVPLKEAQILYYSEVRKGHPIFSLHWMRTQGKDFLLH